MASKPHKPNDPRLVGRKPGRPVWKQIEEEIAKELSAGIYPPGSKLPTEPELMARFAVGRHTMRQAMAELEAKGLVRIEQGRGTFVHDELVHYKISPRTRFSQNLLDQGRDPTYQVIDSHHMPAPDAARVALKLDAAARVILLEVNSFAGEVIIATSNVYFPADRFPDVAHFYAEFKSTTRTYQHYGIDDYKRQSTRISSRPPTDDEARKLFQPVSRPVMITKKVDVDASGNPISYSETLWCSDRVEFSMEH